MPARRKIGRTCYIFRAKCTFLKGDRIFRQEVRLALPFLLRTIPIGLKSGNARHGLTVDGEPKRASPRGAFEEIENRRVALAGNDLEVALLPKPALDEITAVFTQPLTPAPATRVLRARKGSRVRRFFLIRLTRLVLSNPLLPRPGRFWLASASGSRAIRRAGER